MRLLQLILSLWWQIETTMRLMMMVVASSLKHFVLWSGTSWLGRNDNVDDMVHVCDGKKKNARRRSFFFVFSWLHGTVRRLISVVNLIGNIHLPFGAITKGGTPAQISFAGFHSTIEMVPNSMIAFTALATVGFLLLGGTPFSSLHTS